MATNATQVEPTPATDKLHQIEESAPELQRGPKWLREHRYQSMQAYNAAPLPRRGLHLWRYTDPAKFLVNREAVADTAYGPDYDKVEAVLHDELRQGHLSAVVTDLGGREIKLEGAEPLFERGVIISKLSDAVMHHPELVRDHLYKLVNGGLGKHEALNGALWNDGVFIYVPRGKTIEQPIHLLREAGLAESSQYPRLLVVTEDNTELTLVDEYGGGSPNRDEGISQSHGAVEIFGGKHSRIRYVVLQRQGAGAHTYLAHRARIEEGATMLTIPLAFGATLAKHNYGVILHGRHSESTMRGLGFGSRHQHYDYHTLHHHAVGETHSDIDHKVVLKDRAMSAYTGLIRIEQNARTCEAFQENRNLLLNKGPRAETIPELEILNEDVRCSHGATIGPLDPLEVFYLESRGIAREKAVRMIVAGFAESTMRQLPTDLRERIERFVIKRLEDI